MNYYLYVVIFCYVTLLTACSGESKTRVTVTSEDADLRALLKVPDHFSLPPIPDYNIPTREKIELGRHLFYDTKLSANQTQSCGSCHEQVLAFSDGIGAPQGSTGQQLVRNSQGLANVAYHPTLTWANKVFLELEDQLQVPIRSDNPIELGVTPSQVDTVLTRFNDDPMYVSLFSNAFPESSTGATMNKIIQALASFCRTLISGDSPYDQYYQGDTSALTEQQLLGFQLFNGEKFECFHCHGGINFSTSYRDNNSNLGTQTYPFFNNGLYNIDDEGSYPIQDQGLFDLTFNPNHRGFFRPPSLRNVELTAPYMHDGSIATLREVIEHYARGGRLIESGPYAGDGRLNPLKSGLIRGFTTTDEEIDAVIAFLQSLTDESFVHNTDFANPFTE
jgi:cytochrome c peroxidase